MTDDEQKRFDDERRVYAVAALDSAEEEFLLAHGWTRSDPGKDEWTPPEGLRRTYPHTRGHAVNSQKQRIHRGRFAP